MRLPVAIAAVLALAACAGGSPTGSSSGAGELTQSRITLSHVDFACVRAGFTEELVSRGLQISSTSDDEIVAYRRLTMASSLLAGSPASVYSELRDTITFVPSADNGLRVGLQETVVQSPGTAFEKANPVPATQQQQDFLDTGKRIEGSCPAKNFPQ